MTLTYMLAYQAGIDHGRFVEIYGGDIDSGPNFDTTPDPDFLTEYLDGWNAGVKAYKDSLDQRDC